MKIQHIDVDDIGHYPELCERLNVNPDLENRDNGDNSIDEQMQDCWYDCDYVKLDGEDGRGNHQFIDVKTNDTRFIIHRDIDNDDAIAVIDWWLNGAEGDLIGNDGLGNTWYDWEAVKTGIAYRGGSGYCYGLYAKELNQTR